MVQENVPEIVRCDPTQLILRLRSLGVKDLSTFEFFNEKPSRSLLAKSFDFLYKVNAVDI